MEHSLKIGDSIKASKDVNYLYHPDEYFILKDKSYPVVSINEESEDDSNIKCFAILDESGEFHLFDFPSFNEYFYK